LSSTVDRNAVTCAGLAVSDARCQVAQMGSTPSILLAWVFGPCTAWSIGSKALHLKGFGYYGKLTIYFIAMK
jgi:hypothetical protein